jgi:hypothetical protein
LEAITPLEWGLVIAILCVLVAIALPALSTAYPASPSGLCMAQLRQISTGLQIYVNANRGVYPQRLTDIYTIGMPTKLFACPVSKTETPAAQGATPQQTIANLLAGKHITYVYLAGGRRQAVLKPWAVIAYEPVANHGRAPKAYAAVLFNDGHVALIPAAALAKMVQELAAGQNPPPSAGPY